MIELSISWNDREPLYMQLYLHIRDLVHNGIIKDGVKLPSVRSLRQQLNISKSTVENAYQILLTEGYVLSKPRSGLYIMNTNSDHQTLRHQNHDSPMPRYDLHQASRTEVISKVSYLEFSTTAVDCDTFPIRSWRQMLSEALELNRSQVHKYGDSQGEYGLREAIAQYLLHSRGVVCVPEQIVVGSGIKYSMNILAELLKDKRKIAIEEPGYLPVRTSLLKRGFEVIPIPVNEKGLLVNELAKSDAQAIYVTPSHQYPTGGILPYSERQQLLQWAYDQNAYIIEDDYDGEFRYIGKPIPSLQGLDRQGTVIYLGTFSKSFTPAIRMGYMILPMELTYKLQYNKHTLTSTSRIEQWAMQLFMERGYWSRHIKRMRNIYRKKHQHMLHLIHSYFTNHIEILGHGSGLHIEMLVRSNYTEKDLIALAKDEGILINGLEEMWMKGKNTAYPSFYLGFGGLTADQMERGIALLWKAWSKTFN